ncbi:MAG: elongation factor Ts [Minisyncoccota bacterium]
MITMDEIKALRDKTGISVMQCKKALEEAEGDQTKALAILRKKSSDAASKKSDRELGSGIVASYIHNNHAVGAMVELSCETDFVSKNEEFVALAHDIAMHVTAFRPAFVNETQITETERVAAKGLFEKEVAESGKPADTQQKILEGKLAAYFAERTLLLQPFVKDSARSVHEVMSDAVQKFGERIEVRRFVRFSITE